MSRRPLRAAALAASAALLCAGPLLTAQSASAATVSFSSGSLDWGVKASFRDYLASAAAAGTITPTGGATRNSDGTFHFDLDKASYDTTTHAVTSSYGGGLHMTGHSGALDIVLTDLRIDTSGSTGTLTADVSSKQMDGSSTFTGDDVALVTFTVSQSTFSGASAATVLSSAAVKAFAGFYPAGTAMDPVTVKLVQAAASSSASASTSAGPSKSAGSTPTTSTPTKSASASTSAGAAPTKSAAGASASSSASASAAASTTASASASASATRATVAGVTASPSSSGTGALAETGSDSSTLPLALTGTALVLAGGATTVVLRRRRAAGHS
ncbi:MULTISPECIES: HtaA domain-containing protein [Streptacidiphilus]|uniref:HtaA domain-containing protein n=1 Tax=Streptacidiphilus cavernicola TaxID=3342716 RepID=A0ABV6USK8_9ACTN|nr:HtaA domain-containing protein [Streptacidiphilus jeojiense]